MTKIKAPALQGQRKANANFAQLVGNLSNKRLEIASVILEGYAAAGGAGSVEEQVSDALEAADALLLRVYGAQGEAEALNLALKIIENEQAATAEDAGAQD